MSICVVIIISTHCIFVLYILQWVSHRNHRGNICGVDFIWLCNPNKSRKLLKTSWCEAVFGILRVRNSYTQFFFYFKYNIHSSNVFFVYCMGHKRGVLVVHVKLIKMQTNKADTKC